MVKKRFSGQTVAIIVLSILLLLAICFGAVYAYYTNSTNKIYGKIEMAFLNIDLLVDSSSGYSEILNSTGLHVPGQPLYNSPLKINNYSNTETYLVVVYRVNTDKEVVNYDDSKPLIDIGLTEQSEWEDFLFVSYDGSVRTRCLITKQPVAPATSRDDPNEVEVIGKDMLKVPTTWRENYMDMTISFAFQAFAIGADTFQFTEDDTTQTKYNKIVSAIYTDNHHLSIWTEKYINT